jgi:hypothetical protein
MVNQIRTKLLGVEIMMGLEKPSLPGVNLSTRHRVHGQWRHLDTCQYQTILHAEPLRSKCRDHGVRVVKMP